MEKFLKCLVATIAVCIVALCLTSTVMAIRSNGETDYCYVEMWSPSQMAPQFELVGHRPWRSDRMIGVYPTVEDAKARADTLGCKFNGTH